MPRKHEEAGCGVEEAKAAESPRRRRRVSRSDPSPPVVAAFVGLDRPPRGLGMSPKEESDMWHSGMDVHSRLTAFHILDGAGQRLAAGTIPTTEASLGEFCRALAKATHFYLEASTGSAWVARVIDANGHRVTVVDPNRIRAISGSPKKTDASDAATLATLGRAGLLTAVHVRSAETDRFRRVLTARHALVRARANLMRATRSLLRSEGHLLPRCDGDDFAARLRGTWEIPEGHAETVEPLAEAIDQLTGQVLELEKHVAEVAKANAPVVRLLRGIPGVGELVATSFMALVEDPARFRSSSEVAAYLGLTPWVNESAGKRREGGITKRGNRATRALLVQAAWSHMRCGMDTALKRWFHKLEKRLGSKKAITAVARKIGELMWTMWRKGVGYEPFPPSARRSPAPT